MSRSLIQVANPSTEPVNAGSVIPLGSVQRRFGCNLRLSGDAELSNESVQNYTFSPNATGEVALTLPEAPSGKVAD